MNYDFQRNVAIYVSFKLIESLTMKWESEYGFLNAMLFWIAHFPFHSHADGATIVLLN